jgi:hypothetical protein
MRTAVNAADDNETDLGEFKMGRNVKTSEPRKTTAEIRWQRHEGKAGGHISNESKGYDDGGGSEEQSKGAARLYKAASASRGDTGSEGLGDDPALRKR